MQVTIPTPLAANEKQQHHGDACSRGLIAMAEMHLIADAYSAEESDDFAKYMMKENRKLGAKALLQKARDIEALAESCTRAVQALRVAGVGYGIKEVLDSDDEALFVRLG